MNSNILGTVVPFILLKNSDTTAQENLYESSLELFSSWFSALLKDIMKVLEATTIKTAQTGGNEGGCGFEVEAKSPGSEALIPT
jgi:hypothetical protein